MARGRDDEVPGDFPDELRPHARAAMRVLLDVAAHRGAKTISARALGVTIMARPRKPIVKTAHDVASWIYDHPERQCKDVLARYRNWLDGEADLAGLERLPGEGPPVREGGNVTSLRPNASEAERRRARQEDRARRAQTPAERVAEEQRVLGA